jgi:hypothetical protein
MQSSQAEASSTVDRIVANDAITQDMVDAATKLYKSAFFRGWHVSNAALEKLSSDLRNDWSEASCLLKAVAVNELYGTNVYTVIPAARHISQIMSENSVPDMSLVERIAEQPHTRKHYVSFASKFCHFFIDQDRFPIFDDRACKALGHFLGTRYQESKIERYKAFVSSLNMLLGECKSVTANSRDFDRFLWIVGSWMHFQKSQQVNSELKYLFEKRPKSLGSLLPKSLHYGRTFNGNDNP